MDTWQYLNKYNKPVTRKQFEFRRLTADKVETKTGIFISEIEYKRKYQPEYKRKVGIASRSVEIFRKVPWILSVAVTGSVASEYPDVEDDIDLMFICKKNSLWVSRVGVYILAFLFGIKLRRSESVIQDRLCLNLWIEDGYIVPKEKQNLKNAMDSILAKPIWGKEYFVDFLLKNKWIGKYVSKGYVQKTQNNNLETKTTEQQVNVLVRLLNHIAYWSCLVYMKKRGREIVGFDHAFFHP